MKSILAIGNAVGYELGTRAIVLQSDSLQTSGLNLGLTMEKITGGIGNPLQGYLPHTTEFGLTLEDSLFDLSYMALNCGGDISASADVMTVVSFTTTVENTITAPTTPVAFDGDSTVYGWWKLAGAKDWNTTPITFTGSDATVSGLEVGTDICLKYTHTDSTAREFTIGGSFLPKIITLEVEWSLYATSDSADGGQAYIGKLQYIIPKFQFAGAQTYSVSSSGATTSPISGTALVNPATTCSGTGYYAKVKEVIFDKETFDNVESIMIEGSAGGFELEAEETETLKIYATYSDGTIPSLLDNSLFTFTSGTTATATVTENGGVITGVAVGTTVITVVATDDVTLETNCSVEVTA